MIQTEDPGGHDYDDALVIRGFANGIVWAKSHNIHVDETVDHAAAFIASRDAGEPVIPDFMRRYCAHVTGTACHEPIIVRKVDTKAPPAPAARLRTDRPHVPRVPVRRVQSFARL